MSELRIFLFGRFHVCCGEKVLQGLAARKVQELFCYLLLYRHRPHPRETLADLLWGDCPPAHSKKYLRQALWQLQSALGSQTGSANGRVLVVEPEWVCLNPEADLWLDVAIFEETCGSVQGMSGRGMDAQQAKAVQRGVQLYQGDLLEGWYQDWCLNERERLQNMYLAMLDKLITYCEAQGDYEAGMAYGADILRYDRAREYAHRRLMRLQYLAGDRTAALRQYDRCVAILEEELGVKPAKRTVALYQQILADQLDDHSPATADTHPAIEALTAPLQHALGRLTALQGHLAEVQDEMQREIKAIQLASISRN